MIDRIHDQNGALITEVKDSANHVILEARVYPKVAGQPACVGLWPTVSAHRIPTAILREITDALDELGDNADMLNGYYRPHLRRGDQVAVSAWSALSVEAARYGWTIWLRRPRPWRWRALAFDEHQTLRHWVTPRRKQTAIAELAERLHGHNGLPTHLA